jgi:quinol monooxygenase YgiN
MIVVEAWMTSHPENVDEFAAAAAELVARTQEETDFRAYRCCRDLDDQSRFLFIEQWDDRDALGRHARSPHYQAFSALTQEWLAGKEVTIHDVQPTADA